MGIISDKNDVARARAILRTAKENDVWEPEIPEDDEELIKQAAFVLDEANKAWQNKVRGEAVTAVLYAAEVEFHVDEEPPPMAQDDTDEYEDPPPTEDPEELIIRRHSSPPSEPPRDKKFEANEFAKFQAKKHNLPVPEQPEGEPPEIITPGLAQLSIDELQERLVNASLCHSVAIWQTAVAQIDVEYAKRIGDHYYNKAFKLAVVNAKNKDAAVAEAEESATVREWRQAEADAKDAYVAYRALKEIYDGQHSTISRVFTMKVEERERARS